MTPVDFVDAAAPSAALASGEEGNAVAASSARSRRRLDRRARVAAAISIAGLVLAAAVLVIAVLWAVAPQWFTSLDPTFVDVTRKYLPPGPGALLGTDSLGRDLYTRIVYAAALSLQAALVAVAVGFVAGTLLGLVAGYAGGWLDTVVMRLGDVSLALPGILLSLLVITALGAGTVNVAIAVGVGLTAAFARLTRGETIRITALPYVEAARADGIGRLRILGRYVLPNAVRPVIALATLDVGTAILSVASLGFLGYGAPPPTPEWGMLVAEGRNGLPTYWWVALFPGLVVTVVVLATSALGRHLSRSAS